MPQEGIRPTKRSEADNSLVIHFKNLRKAVGCIGIALPVVLVAGRYLFDGRGLLDSLSSYYHSVMRDVFVGSLCAVGTFLVSYKGYDERDDRAGWIAGTSVIGVALCPTSMEAQPGSANALTGTLHVIFAFIYFATLAYFALVLFRQTDPQATRTPQKRKRDVVYAICGGTIVGCLLLIALVYVLPTDSAVRHPHPILWLESLAVFAFGLSWFTKGEWLFPDPQ